MVLFLLQTIPGVLSLALEHLKNNETKIWYVPKKNNLVDEEAGIQESAELSKIIQTSRVVKPRELNNLDNITVQPQISEVVKKLSEGSDSSPEQCYLCLPYFICLPLGCWLSNLYLQTRSFSWFSLLNVSLGFSTSTSKYTWLKSNYYSHFSDNNSEAQIS